MQASDTNPNLLCAVLAAQVAALRDRLDIAAPVDLMWRTTDVLSQLSALIRDLLQRNPVPELDQHCTAAIAVSGGISLALDDMAFQQAQSQDLSRQMADCVVTALERLAADTPAGTGLSLGELAELYVCEDQLKVHNAVTRRFAIDPTEALRSPRSKGDPLGGDRT